MRRFYAAHRSNLLLLFLACAVACSGSGDRWYRGNTHTHTLWSDGDAAPEFVVAWYRDHGYDWLSITDHDVLLRVERWAPISDGGYLTLARVGELRNTFGEDWVETRDTDAGASMRLKTLQDLRDQFEEPEEFLLVEAQEIGGEAEGKPVDLNVYNPAELIASPGGVTIRETIERSLAAVNGMAEAHGRNMLATLNHPNWHWAVTPEQLALMEGTTLFEVYNGSTGCNNYGDSAHPGMDEAWDIANTLRLSQLGLPPLLGVATDDAHDYFDYAATRSNPGRGWIMVRADSLSTDEILNALRAGDFYSSTGVALDDVQVGPEEYVVRIAAERGVSYATQFIGTRVTHGIPGPAGVILHETTDRKAVYRFRGDELYVRAKVISSRMQTNPLLGEEAPEYAWTQPVVPTRR